MAEIDDVLKARGQTNGDYGLMCERIWAIKGAIRDGNFHKLAPLQKEALDMIAHKLGRIVQGDPNHEDHWRDIAGYATLVADRLQPKRAVRVCSVCGHTEPCLRAMCPLTKD